MNIKSVVFSIFLLIASCSAETIKIFKLEVPLETLKNKNVIKNAAYFRTHYIDSDGKLREDVTIGRYNFHSSYSVPLNESNLNPYLLKVIKGILIKYLNRYKKHYSNMGSKMTCLAEVVTFYDKNHNLLSIVDTGAGGAYGFTHPYYKFSRLDNNVNRVTSEAKIIMDPKLGKVIIFYDLQGNAITPSIEYDGDKNLTEKFKKYVQTHLKVELNKNNLIIKDRT